MVATSETTLAVARPRGVPVFSVYDGRRLIGDVFETARGFVTVDAAGAVAGPFADRKAAAAALRAGRAAA